MTMTITTSIGTSSMHPLTRITKARAALVCDQPFFGSLALRLNPVEDPTVETAWTDGRSLGYNPDYVASLTMPRLTALIAHEVMHLALCHHTRQGPRDTHRWNVAGDFAINQVLIDARFDLPENCLIDEAYKGMSAEAIYDVLAQEEAEKKAGPQGDPGQDSAAGDQQGNNQSPDPGQQPGSDPGAERGQNHGPVGEDINEASPSMFGEVCPLPGNPSSSDLKLEEQAVKVSITQAIQQSKAMGKAPGPGFERLVKSTVFPKVDWREVLRDFMDVAVRSDYSWLRPNPRYISQGIYLPSLNSREVGSIVVVIDTSGSVSQNQLELFSAEVTSLLEEFPATLEVIYADFEVQGHEVFTQSDLPVTLQLNGGGGTDFRPAFRFVDTDLPLPSCLIYMTDLACSRYPEKDSYPDYPVLWVNTEADGWRLSDPPFGRVITMD